MNISPVSFRGQITIKTQKDRNSAVETQVYKTTKKQDGELLKSAADTLTQLGYRENIYGKDVIKFHEKIEKIIGKPLEQSSLGNRKLLIIGGPGEYSLDTKYNTSYNKIFYYDTTYGAYPDNSVTVDLMEPEERYKAAMQTLSQIQDRLSTILGAKDHRLDNIKSEFPESKYADMEKVLNKTLFYLDGKLDGPDFSDKAPEPPNKFSAYETLIQQIHKATGTTLRNKAFYSDNFSDYENITNKDMENIKRASYYLSKALPALYNSQK